jgi:hypothetical protein
MVTRRSKQDMPKQGQVVVISAETSKYNGSAGYVTELKSSERPGRPYTVRFNDGVTRNFRRGEVWLAD